MQTDQSDLIRFSSIQPDVSDNRFLIQIQKKQLNQFYPIYPILFD